jgi:hypothetical protein
VSGTLVALLGLAYWTGGTRRSDTPRPAPAPAKVDPKVTVPPDTPPAPKIEPSRAFYLTVMYEPRWVGGEQLGVLNLARFQKFLTDENVVLSVVRRDSPEYKSRNLSIYFAADDSFVFVLQDEAGRVRDVFRTADEATVMGRIRKLTGSR